MFKQIKSKDASIFNIPNRDNQILVIKNVLLVDGINIRLNYILDDFKNNGIGISLLTMEYPIYSDTVIYGTMNNQPIDAFFSISINEINNDAKNFLIFNILKEKYQMIYIEDIVVLNPLYKYDPWYSDKISDSISWGITNELQEMLADNFNEVIQTFPDEIKNYPSILVKMFSIKSRIPAYVGDNISEQIKDFVTELQMRTLKINEDIVKELSTSENIDFFDFLIGNIKTLTDKYKSEPMDFDSLYETVIKYIFLLTAHIKDGTQETKLKDKDLDRIKGFIDGFFSSMIKDKFNQDIFELPNLSEKEAI